MRLRRARFDLILLTALALVAHFTYLYYSDGDYFFPDSKTYLTPAHNLLNGDGFAVESGLPETFRTPGYPVFLLPFIAATTNALPIVIVQHLLIVLLVAAVYLYTRRITGSRSGAFVAGLLAALDVSTILYSNKVLSETLFTCVLFALFVLALRMRRRGATLPLMIVAGAIAGMLVLIRPVAILYFVVLAIFFATTESLRRVLAFTLVAIAIPVGWGIRNRVETGVFTIASVAGANMLIHRAAPSIAIWGHGEFEEDLATWQARLQAAADREIVKEEEVRSINDLEAPLVHQYYGTIGRRIALQHPLGLALVTLRGLLVNLFESDFESVMIVSRIPSVVIEYVLNILTAVVTLLSLLGVFALWKRQRAVAGLIAATIVYFVFMSAGSEAESRFRVPVVPMMAIAAGAGAEALRRGLRDLNA